MSIQGNVHTRKQLSFYFFLILPGFYIFNKTVLYSINLSVNFINKTQAIINNSKILLATNLAIKKNFRLLFGYELRIFGYEKGGGVWQHCP